MSNDNLAERFRCYSTDQLQDIYHENNQNEFSPAELRVVREILEDCGVAVPDQLEFPRTRKDPESKMGPDQKGEAVKSSLDIARELSKQTAFESPEAESPKLPRKGAYSFVWAVLAGLGTGLTLWYYLGIEETSITEECLLFFSILSNFTTRLAFEEFMKVARPSVLDGRYRNFAAVPLWLCKIKAQFIFNMICLVPIFLVLTDMGWGFLNVKWWVVLIVAIFGYLGACIILMIVEATKFRLTLFLFLTIPVTYVTSILLWLLPL